MINLLLYGALAFVGVKIVGGQKSGNTSAAVRNTRSQVPTSPAYARGTNNVPQGVNPTIGPSSGLSRPAGNAGQPWYTGAVVSATGVAAKEIVGGIADLFKTSEDPMVEYEVDDEDLSDATDEMASASNSSTEDNEDFSMEAVDSSEDYYV